MSNSQYHLAVADGSVSFALSDGADRPIRYRKMVLTALQLDESSQEDLLYPRVSVVK